MFSLHHFHLSMYYVCLLITYEPWKLKMPSVKFFFKIFKSRELFVKMNVTINKPGQFIIAPGGLTKLHANFGRKGNDYEKSK